MTKRKSFMQRFLITLSLYLILPGAVYCAEGELEVGGSVTGMGPHKRSVVTCRNLTTRKTVKIDISDGSTAWDCVQAGLSVAPGDKIKQTITVVGAAGIPNSTTAAGQPELAALTHENYQFTYTKSCFCIRRGVETVITVKNGKVVSAYEKETQAPLDEAALQQLPTLKGLRNIIADAEARKAAVLRVSYEETYGYPEYIYIDYVSEMADDEIEYDVTDFVPM